jgi:glycosyltransferase involved in cell wall biosynthesis
VGRITRQKGIIHLVNAIPDIDPSLQVVLCAGAPDTPEIGHEMTERIQAVSKDRPGVVWVQEMLARPDVIQMYSHAAVFCCPSVYEPFGIINLEAMACETPVVASAVGGIVEVVEDGKTGLMVPPAQPEVLADALGRVLKNPELGRRMGKAGRARVEAKFSWASVAERTEQVYADAIADFKRTAE